MPLQTLSLDNIGGGVLFEKFEDELHKIIENVLDPNTEATAKREIIIKVAFTPSKDRREVGIEISSNAKLAPTISAESRAFFRRDSKTGRTYAFGDDPSQVQFDFSTAPQSPENVKPINKAQ